jgi:hypothetical protein
MAIFSLFICNLENIWFKKYFLMFGSYENRQIFFIFSYNLKSYEKKRDNEGELLRKSTV